MSGHQLEPDFLKFDSQLMDYYCKMYFRFWQGKVSVYHTSDGFTVIHQITRKILPGNPVKIRFFENSGKSGKSES